MRKEIPKETNPKTINKLANPTIFPSLKNTFYSHDISLVPLCKEHLGKIAPFLQAQDRAEMWAAYRLPEEEVLDLCYRRSAVSFAFLYRSCVCAVCGVEAESLLGGRGNLWSWTSQYIKSCPKLFFILSRYVLGYFLSLYAPLYVLCDERHLAARRYLQRLGAEKKAENIFLAGEETRFMLYQFNRPTHGLGNQ